ncbi:acetyl-CoA carboxylase biotin carboxyl carrier protein [Salsuginibacillus halophilus]|uniref:Biotin carboxyl carrier protein of acetyl-CoA carboxylase n=1 Tax=Salsuginibacillus halophilus TaxID=517424 RepID=A0A2P8HXM5_9BACI|nr:acetyl-CoA carboxylase biotin carboxyl carrier protein [Salsuginibacillus halophilus]PSL50970.1 acetyl-CoA carboxylase biotin carboxyl carrier protein [Salsuginibacillus halophilus]
MYDVNEIKELIRAVDRSSVGELEIKGDDKAKLTIKKEGQNTVVQTPVETQIQAAAPAPAPAAPVQAPESSSGAPAQAAEEKEIDESLQKITSPMVGTFYRAPSPDSDVYVNPGDTVQQDSVVCIVEAMKLMNELEAEVSGEIKDILVEDGELVEYGQPLFTVKSK